MSQDQIFTEPRDHLVDFAFDDTVAEVFPDMIRRSVPGYEFVIPMSGLLAARHASGQSDPLIYDLGCSLGATSMATLRAWDGLQQEARLKIEAVDSSEAMLTKARNLISDERIIFVQADITEYPLQSCAAILLNYVLQFVDPGARLNLLRRLREATGRDGALLVSEKVRFKDPELDAFNTSAHLDFKRANGYSELEISQKRSALENVMVIDTIEEHLDRFETAGFGNTRIWYQCLNWVSFLARP